MVILSIIFDGSDILINLKLFLNQLGMTSVKVIL